jgi:hypothetical protein
LRGNASSEALVRILIGMFGMQVDVDLLERSDGVTLAIEGNVDADDVALAAVSIVPNLEELVALKPQWHSGMTGLMQLIVLTQLAQAIRAAEVA